ncbi:helix-turn-helix domain-containing protein [Kribbella sp. NPDC051718]|uniref:helix-turn-helix domain-containing protein n=1 Tax=Kribbella sp. NPDC051718 TaxID=3155168 RepID=UPI00342A03CD
MTEVEPLWDINQVSTYLKVPKATLYGWRGKKYGPPADRVGRHLRYDRQDSSPGRKALARSTHPLSIPPTN